jgi:glycosyltransferase involved in cell wall biosynthesis
MRTDEPLVSVIMPLYNGEAFLEAAVASVRAQSWKNWELLIVDDGSKDGSLQRARRLAGDDPQVRVLQHPGGANRGVSHTRNLAIESSTGDWIALLDCDDVWLPDKLARQIDVLRAHPDLCLVYSKAQVIDDAGRIVERQLHNMNRPPVFGNGVPDTPVHDFEGFLRGRYWPPTASVIFPRAAAAACGNFEPLPYQVEDTLLFARLAARGALWFTDEVLVQYRIHGKQWNSRLNPSKHAEGRFCYLSALARTLGGDSGRVAGDVLAHEGLKALGQTLISGREMRVSRFLGYGFELLRAPFLSARQKLHVAAIMLGRLLAAPLQAVVRWRVARRRGAAGGDAVTTPGAGRPAA